MTNKLKTYEIEKNLSLQIILIVYSDPWVDPDCRGLAGLAGSLCLGGVGKVAQFGSIHE